MLVKVLRIIALATVPLVGEMVDSGVIGLSVGMSAGVDVKVREGVLAALECISALLLS